VLRKNGPNEARKAAKGTEDAFAAVHIRPLSDHMVCTCADDALEKLR
jgi:hypothetical protein